MLNDAYYTKPLISMELINDLSKLYDFNDFDYIIEPSAGNGSFSKYFNENFNNKLIAIDIDPKESYMIKEDFLNYDLSFVDGKKNLFIGNPPFSYKVLNGFIKKICKYANVISLILPNSFKNHNRMKLIHLNYHLIKIIDIGMNAFIDNCNNEYNYNTSFFIFEKRNYLRINNIKTKPKYYKFVGINDNFDYFITRVGIKCSKIYQYDNKKIYNKYHFYLKLDDFINKNKFIEFYNNIEFNDCINNTTTFKSLPKYLLIEKLNEFIY